MNVRLVIVVERAGEKGNKKGNRTLKNEEMREPKCFPKRISMAAVVNLSQRAHQLVSRRRFFTLEQS
jgi:hypothetical protein